MSYRPSGAAARLPVPARVVSVHLAHCCAVACQHHVAAALHRARDRDVTVRDALAALRTLAAAHCEPDVHAAIDHGLHLYLLDPGPSEALPLDVRGLLHLALVGGSAAVLRILGVLDAASRAISLDVDLATALLTHGSAPLRAATLLRLGQTAAPLTPLRDHTVVGIPPRVIAHWRPRA